MLADPAAQALLVDDFRGKVDGGVIIVQMGFEFLPYRFRIDDSDMVGILGDQQLG